MGESTSHPGSFANIISIVYDVEDWEALGHRILIPTHNAFLDLLRGGNTETQMLGLSFSAQHFPWCSGEKTAK